MSKSATIVVMFDQIEREAFFRRLDWDALVRAWSGTIRWRRIGQTRVRLELDGLDGLQTIIVSRKHIGDKIFIAARDESGDLLQTGAWFFDAESGTACCVRRVHRPDLVETLCDRLPAFCCATFLYDGAPDD